MSAVPSSGSGSYIFSLEDDHSLTVCHTWTSEIIGSGGTCHTCTDNNIVNHISRERFLFVVTEE